MKQLVMLAAAGLMALLLSGCGEDTPKQPEAKPEHSHSSIQPMQKTDEMKQHDENDVGVVTDNDTEEE